VKKADSHSVKKWPKNRRRVQEYVWQERAHPRRKKDAQKEEKSPFQNKIRIRIAGQRGSNGIKGAHAFASVNGDQGKAKGNQKIPQPGCERPLSPIGGVGVGGGEKW